MTIKTVIRLTLSGGILVHPKYYRVKLDSQGFPHIIIENDKYIINSAVFPRELLADYGRTKYFVDIEEGLDVLQRVLANPDLTLDKLQGPDVFHVG